VTDLSEQVIEERWVREGIADSSEDVDEPAPATAVVAVVVGDGSVASLRHSGFGASSRWSVHESLDGRPGRSGARHRLERGRDPSEQQEHSSGRRAGERARRAVVTVVPTNSIVEGFAALLAYDPDATAEQNRTSMGASACNVVAGE